MQSHPLPLAVAFAAGLALGLWLDVGPAPGPSPSSAAPSAPPPSAAPTPWTWAEPPVRVEPPRQAQTPQGVTLEAALAAIDADLAAQRLTRAGEQLSTLLERYPYEPRALLLRVRWLAADGRLREALDLLLERRSLERDAGRAEAIEALLPKLLDAALTAAKGREDSAARLDLLQLATTALPNVLGYQWQLAEAHFEQHQYGATRLALQGLLYDPDWGERAQRLDQRAQRRLALANGYRHRLPVQRRGKHHLIEVRVNATPVTLLIDTGASISLLTPEAAARAGLAGDGREVRLMTVGGVVVAPLVKAQVALQGMGALGLDLAIQGGMFEGVDGLLGMDLLGQYQFYLDQERELLLLEEGAP